MSEFILFGGRSKVAHLRHAKAYKRRYTGCNLAMHSSDVKAGSVPKGFSVCKNCSKDRIYGKRK